MSEAVLFVAGLGRCGTTMMMTMLDAGGFPAAGPRPSYEPVDQWRLGRPDPAWIAAQGGRAVKWIDPTRCLTMRNLLPVAPIIILMERNPREQARSQVKLMRDLVPGPARHIEKAMERSIRRDIPLVRARMKSTGPVYRMTFEDVLSAPLAAASMLRQIVDEHFGVLFDSGSAARAVIPRHPSCAPDMAMETMILPAIAEDLEACHG